MILLWISCKGETFWSVFWGIYDFTVDLADMFYCFGGGVL